MKLLVIIGLCAVSGCSWFKSTQGQQTVTTAVDLTICVLNHSTEPVEQIATDCGAQTISDVVKILDAHKAAELREAAYEKRDTK